VKQNRSRSRTCPNPDCSLKGKLDKGNIIRHSYYITSQGRRRRYCCKECGRTFSSIYGTPYYRLPRPRTLFDEVVHKSIHGIGISSIAEIKRMAWGTVARWQELAATFAKRFNLRMLKDFVIHELQADEFRTTIKTPAMQAGLVKKCLSFRDLFTSQGACFFLFLMVAVMRKGRLDYRSVSVMFWRSRYPTTVP